MGDCKTVKRFITSPNHKRSTEITQAGLGFLFAIEIGIYLPWKRRLRKKVAKQKKGFECHLPFLVDDQFQTLAPQQFRLLAAVGNKFYEQPFVCGFQFQMTLFVTPCEICLCQPAVYFGNHQVNKALSSKKAKAPSTAHRKPTFSRFEVINILIHLRTEGTIAQENELHSASCAFRPNSSRVSFVLN